MKMITGFISPDTGDVKVDGLSVKDNSYAVRQSIGYLPEGAPHYGEMMTKDFLKFIINGSIFIQCNSPYKKLHPYNYF